MTLPETVARIAAHLPESEGYELLEYAIWLLATVTPTAEEQDASPSTGTGSDWPRDDHRPAVLPG